MMGPAGEPDPFLTALDRLEEVLHENSRRTEQMLERIEEIRRHRAQDRPYAEIVPVERRPLILQLLTESATALDSTGVVVRRMEAQALYDEGMTMDAIAKLFGVTRQRVGALLRGRNDNS